MPIDSIEGYDELIKILLPQMDPEAGRWSFMLLKECAGQISWHWRILILLSTKHFLAIAIPTQMQKQSFMHVAVNKAQNMQKRELFTYG